MLLVIWVLALQGEEGVSGGRECGVEMNREVMGCPSGPSRNVTSWAASGPSRNSDHNKHTRFRKPRPHAARVKNLDPRCAAHAAGTFALCR